MEEVWKDSLVKVPPELRQKLIEGKIESLPSPAELRGKILIKVKSAPHSAKGDTPPQDSSSIEGEVLGPVTTSPSTSSEEAVRAGGGEKPEKAEKKAKIIEELSALGIYTSAFSFKGFDAPESRLANHIFSLSEPKLLDYFKRDRRTLFEHNRNYMMRSYPSQRRVTSSNPDPSFSWRQGVQFAALNWQNTDLGMMLNRAMFEDSGGWVVKPEPYRCDAWRNNLKKPLEDSRRTISLMIDVYAGQDIPLRTNYTNPKKFHPYVTCQLHVEKPGESIEAHPSASSEKLYYENWKRKTEASTGANPDFDGQRLQFARCSGVIEKLAFVR
ncbi:hypothetical protein KEM55_003231 [Ascosphaera atra]|nr:hypothetical protein KEM55_003231 [Ascosphaera atra]